MVPIYLLIDLGIFLVIYARFGERVGLPALLLWYHLFFGIFIGLGIYLGTRAYKKKGVPIIEQIRELKKAFTAEFED
jgi:hypothetical protein